VKIRITLNRKPNRERLNNFPKCGPMVPQPWADNRLLLGVPIPRQDGQAPGLRSVARPGFLFPERFSDGVPLLAARRLVTIPNTHCLLLNSWGLREASSAGPNHGSPSFHRKQWHTTDAIEVVGGAHPYGEIRSASTSTCLSDRSFGPSVWYSTSCTVMFRSIARDAAVAADWPRIMNTGSMRIEP
jgi:hypothetical protein